MTKFLLTVLAGLVLGLIIHLVAILELPHLAQDRIAQKFATLGTQPDQLSVFKTPVQGQPNPLGLDPELVYAACRFDLTLGPGTFSGELPDEFWSIGLYDLQGVAVYSTTNRSGVGRSLTLGVFNTNQSRLLRDQEFEVEEGMLIVESPSDQVTALLRLSVPYPEIQDRYLRALENLQCRHIEVPTSE